MATAPISSLASPVVSAAADTAQSRIAENFDTFLMLLTTQLKNQDPLSPMDSTQFTQQLVQFSQVEQQIAQNKNLETLIGLTRSRTAADAVAYLGKTLTFTDGSGPLIDGSAAWTYTLNGSADATAITIADARGRVVYAAPGATAGGAHEFVWDGKDNAGNQLPDGYYALTVRALLADGNPVASTVRSSGVVTEVDLSGSEPLLMIGPMIVPMSFATLVSGD
jgi:flagellar basal-body rod modification protein FlgD